MGQNIESLYQKISDETDKFTKINCNILVKYPNAIRIFRLLAGHDQRSFAKLIGKNQQWVSAIERCFIHSISEAEAKRIANVIRKLGAATVGANVISVLQIEIANRGKFSGEYAREMALKSAGTNSIRSAELQKPTEQEKAISIALHNAGINFQMHAPIKVGKVTFVCDFLVGKEPIIIEAKNLTTKYRIKALISELAYRALRIRRYHPNAKLIAVLNRNAITPTSEKIILSEEFDSLFFDDELEKLAIEISGSGFER